MFITDGTRNGTRPYKKPDHFPPDGKSIRIFENEIYLFKEDHKNQETKIWKIEKATGEQVLQYTIKYPDISIIGMFKGNLLINAFNSSSYLKSAGIYFLRPSGDHILLFPHLIAYKILIQNNEKFVIIGTYDSYLYPEVFISDGTIENSRSMKITNGRSLRRYNIQDTKCGNKIYLLMEGYTWKELWKTDGSDTGTHIIYKFPDENFHSFTSELESNNDRLYLSTYSSDYGKELFTLDCSDNIAPESSEQIILYPNPAEDFIHLKFPEQISFSDYKIYNTFGKLISEGTIKENKIGIEGLSSGIYILQVGNDRDSKRFNFIKI